MPSRLKTFKQVLPVFARQVDHIFIFLDGFESVPDFLSDMQKVTVIRSQDAGDYHAAGRFLCLQQLTEVSVILPFDDDIHYPRNYVARLVEALERIRGNAVVGFHGTRYHPPYTDYVRDGWVFYYLRGQLRTKRVDLLGAGTAAFITDRLKFDVSTWKTFRSNDVLLALEAKKRHLPLLCIPRPWFWMRPIRERQAYSIWEEAKRDPSEKTALMRELLAERVAEFERRE